MTLEIFEPSLCCESGVCGPEPDKKLIDLQNTILLLKKVGVETERYAINQSPQAFVQNKVVSDFVKTNGPGKLPVCLLDGKIIKEGDYPSLGDLESHIPELRDIEQDKQILGIFS